VCWFSCARQFTEKIGSQQENFLKFMKCDNTGSLVDYHVKKKHCPSVMVQQCGPVTYSSGTTGFWVFMPCIVDVDVCVWSMVITTFTYSSGTAGFELLHATYCWCWCLITTYVEPLIKHHSIMHGITQSLQSQRNSFPFLIWWLTIFSHFMHSKKLMSN